MANTRETMGEQACLDALVADTLTTFEDDGITQVGDSALNWRKALSSVVMSNCTSVVSSGFGNCTNLELVDIKGSGNIGSNAFDNTSIRHLIMRSTERTTLSNVSAFNSTPIAAGEGCVYVDSDLLAWYEANGMWKHYIIRSIEDYPYTNYETIGDSWTEIITACDNGTYDQKYNVGDTKSMVIDGTTYYFQLVAKDADVLAADGITTVPTTWIMFRKLYGESHAMNKTSTSSGGWADSGMRSWLVDTVLPLFPSEVRAAIKEVRKYSGTYENNAVVKDGSVTADKIWIPSNYELNINSLYETQGATYSTDLYSPTNQNARVKYDLTFKAKNWWLRSASTSAHFISVSSSGSASGSSAMGAYGVVLGFCI